MTEEGILPEAEKQPGKRLILASLALHREATAAPRRVRPLIRMTQPQHE